MSDIEHFFQAYQQTLELKICAGEKGLQRKLKKLEIERAGLSLSHCLKRPSSNCILLFGEREMHYLKKVSSKTRIQKLNNILSYKTPFIVVSQNLYPLEEMILLCEKMSIPLFQTNQITSLFSQEITNIFAKEFSPTLSQHGTLVEAFGVGILIQGDSSIGKSETALGLIERGHRLISDDVVLIKKKEGNTLLGTGPALTRHLMEIRGIGIINVAFIYGSSCVRESTQLDVIVKLEAWDEHYFYDRLGVEEKLLELFDIKIPAYTLPVKPGRDVVLLIETLVLNYNLKKIGYNSAKEFKTKLLHTIAKKQKTLYKSACSFQNKKAYQEEKIGDESSSSFPHISL